MNWVENSIVVAHKTLVCFSAGCSWCALPKCCGRGGRAWPPTRKWAHGARCGVAEYPEPLSRLQRAQSRNQPQLWPCRGGRRIVGPSGDPPCSWRCLAPAVRLSARGGFWHDTRRYCLHVFPRAYVLIGYLSFPSHRHFSACALGISTAVPWL